MAAAFRTVHSAAFGAVSIVQDLGRQTGQDRSLSGLEKEFGNRGTVLSEIHHQGFPGIQGHGSVGSIFAGNHHLSKGLFFSTFHLFPDIGLHGREGQVFPQVNFRTVGRQDLSGKLRIHFRLKGKGGEGGLQGLTGIVPLPVKNGSVLHRTAHTGLPGKRIRPEPLAGSVIVQDFQHGPERRFFAQHSFVAAGGHDLVRPPARGNLGRQDIDVAAPLAEHVGDIIGKGAAGLHRVCEARLQHFLPHRLSVHVQGIDTQARGHPPGRNHLVAILQFADK